MSIILLMLHDYKLETLDKLFHFCKDSGGFFFISKRLCDLEIVQEFFKDWIDDVLAYLATDLS